MSVEIVPISVSHAEGFRACLDTVARVKRYLAMTEALPLERMREFVQQNVAADVAQFVALDATLVVGWCDVLPAWPDALRHRGTLGLGLLPAYRGRGVGRRLMTECLAKAHANGLRRIELEARADNLPAIRLYERMGFRHEGLARGAMRYDGVDHDAVRMALLFDDALPH